MLNPNTRNFIDRETDSQSQQLARNTASDLVDTLLSDHKKLKGLKGHTVESLEQNHPELVGKTVFFLSKLVLKTNDRTGIRTFKERLTAEIAKNKNITIEEFFKLISDQLQTKVGDSEFADWEQQYINKHPEGLSKDQMKDRMNEQTIVMGEVLQTQRTTNTYRYVLHVIAKIKKKFRGSPQEIAIRIVNYLRGIKSKNWIKNNRLTNRVKSAWRDKGLLRSGLHHQNLDNEVAEIVKSMELTDQDKNPTTGQPNKDGFAKLTVAQELKQAYRIVRNETEVTDDSFDLAA
ncbi:MAG: hypothetical protein LBG52_04910 [Candidatus Peribacteria bacterium]|jgi:hypothetical protein|nr:hypothetical protein [Candidatus Peribacteria bacterium]